MPNPSRVNRALKSLERCGCLPLLNRYMDLSIEGKVNETSITRLRLCISEQCWSEGDIGNIPLSNHDRSMPFPEVINRCLLNLIENVKGHKTETFSAIREQRILLEDKHRTCCDRPRRDLNVMFEVNKAKVREYEEVRMKEIIDEINSLIRSSTWQTLVNPSKVCNLTSDQVSTIELELLSLGTDFKLENSDRSLLEMPVAFKRFKTRYRGEPGFSDLHSDKVHLLSSIYNDQSKALPRRYNNAMESLKSNEQIMIVVSDKGKQTVVCYMTTFVALTDVHFANRDLYQPVDADDIAGYDITTMKQDLKNELSSLAKKAPDLRHKKIIKSLFPSEYSRFPEGRINLKTHKEGITPTSIPVRPIISNTNSPTDALASYLGHNLTNNLGVVSDKHIGSTEDFANFVNNCSTGGHLLSLDVKSLFTCIPRKQIIEFLRNKSNGWGPNHTQKNSEEPPVYSFDIDSSVFCDLVEICLKYNQFRVKDNFFRQIHGLFMGSSISPPLAMMYLEYFESQLYELNIPENIKAKEWARYVDDCFIVYEHSEDDFQKFLCALNSLDPYIKFTCEKSKTGEEMGLSNEVIEALPFLDLLVIRHLDSISNTLSNKLSIYRKPCHSGAYIHAFSHAPISTKRATIRNMFLRAYRYCDKLYLKAEERKIYDDFCKIGYNRKFIDNARISARKGRDREIRIRDGFEQPRQPREKARFQLGIPYHKSTQGVKHRLGQRDIDVIMTNRDTIMSRITHRKHTCTP